MVAQPDSKILEGVKRYSHEADCFCSFVASMKSILEYVGDPLDYDYVMGASGLAFRRFFQRHDGGNVDPMRLAPDSLQRTFWVLGYDYRVISHAEGRATMLEALKESTGKGIPVLATGIIGPPESGIVCGYSQGGHVLHGWSYFQDPSIDGYYARPDWYENAQWWHSVGLILLGDKLPGPLPSKREVLEATLPWVIQLERETEHPGVPDHVAGLAAYDCWADDLDAGIDYASDDPDVAQMRHWVGMDEAVMVHEAATRRPSCAWSPTPHPRRPICYWPRPTSTAR